MKRVILLSLSLLSLTKAYCQVRNAALMFVNTTKPEVTFYGLKPPRDMNAPRVFFQNGVSFNDTLLFNALKEKVELLLPQISFRVIPEDSVITTPNYRDIVRGAQVDKDANQKSESGYAYPSYTPFGGLNYAKNYFNVQPSPDIIVEASSYFELNNANGTKFADANTVYTNVVCTTTIKGFNAKGKKVFRFNVNYKHPANVRLKLSRFSGWGFELDEDISAYQEQALRECLKLIDAEIPDQLEKVEKFYK